MPRSLSRQFPVLIVQAQQVRLTASSRN
uniref:Uncharacterized protein n=1 Tax=Arundo donax TaxID=35708 RepID=A0A0A9H403_ARUDO